MRRAGTVAAVVTALLVVSACTGDDEWSARAFDGAQVIEAGERVTVVRIAGATALVLADT